MSKGWVADDKSWVAASHSLTSFNLGRWSGIRVDVSVRGRELGPTHKQILYTSHILGNFWHSPLGLYAASLPTMTTKERWYIDLGRDGAFLVFCRMFGQKKYLPQQTSPSVAATYKQASTHTRTHTMTRRRRPSRMVAALFKPL